VRAGGAVLESYAYGTDGDRTGMRAPWRGIEETVAVSLTASGHVLTAGELRATFDQNGFLSARHTADGTATFAFSGLGELESAALPDGRVVSYRLDGAGRRVARLIDGVVVERYLWADATRLLATYDPSGGLTARFTYADGRMPALMATSEGTFHLAYDQVGTLRAVVAGDGTVVKRVVRDSFGNLVSDSAPALRVPFGFAGGLEDADTGLVHFGARDYDPALGRFTARDPIDLAAGDVDLYGYCGGDPIGRVDPSGLWTVAIPLPNSLYFAWSPPQVSGAVNLLAFDGQGNVGIMHTAGVGLSTGVGGVLGTYAQWTDAENICQLRGLGGAFGGSGTLLAGTVPVNVGVEYFTDSKQTYNGWSASIGVGVQVSPEVAGLPGEAHGEVTLTGIPYSVNIPQVVHGLGF
jgi:RHS repeat-associated protein